ncbi:MAG TPA: c-type cytochrome [Polyangiaceae bacterium]|jgi:cytochrome c553/outer membrane lipoprotein SlyB
MGRIVKRVLRVAGVVLVVLLVGAGGYVYMQCSAFDESMAKVYDVPVPALARTTDPAVLARGEHLVHSLAGCGIGDCHGSDLGGGKVTDIGPVGQLCAPNITGAGLGAAYSDGELARIIRHGVKKDGRTVRLMPSQDLTWLPDADVVAIVSYIRSVPDVDRPNSPTVVHTLGKVLDRQGKFPWDVARRIDHARVEAPPSPAPTVEYGGFLARLCTGCHGEHLSGGPLPGAPSSIPTPLDLTPHATGLADWSFEDFDRLMRTGVRKSGRKLDPFMPVDAWKNLDDTEMHALWAYLRTLPPTPFGQR